MSISQVVIVVAVVVVILAALYGLHRLCLVLEARGWIYYIHDRPQTSAAGCFVAVQKFIEPQTEHVLHVHEERRRLSEDDSGDPPDTDGADTTTRSELTPPASIFYAKD